MHSPKYLEQLVYIHGNAKKKTGFGGKVKDLGKFNFFIEQWKPNTVLDYGCGKGVITSTLQEQYPNIKFEGYDPAVQMFNAMPTKKYDCVFSNDVLEHIEPEYIDSVLSHILSLSNNYIWLRIDTTPARKILPDGRNAHLIQESPEWWTNKISKLISPNIVYNNFNKKSRIDIAIEL